MSSCHNGTVVIIKKRAKQHSSLRSAALNVIVGPTTVFWQILTLQSNSKVNSGKAGTNLTTCAKRIMIIKRSGILVKYLFYNIFFSEGFVSIRKVSM